jgi:hypothetical protein
MHVNVTDGIIMLLPNQDIVSFCKKRFQNELYVRQAINDK